jgi:hypothetical protein
MKKALVSVSAAAYSPFAMSSSNALRLVVSILALPGLPGAPAA